MNQRTDGIKHSSQNEEGLLRRIFSVAHLGLLAISILVAVVGFIGYASRTDVVSEVEAQDTLEESETIPGLERFFVVNVPAFFKELVTIAALTVEGGSLFEGESTFQGEVSVENEAFFDARVVLRDDVDGRGVNIDLGSGEITASNVIYSLVAGGGISISEGQTPTISATDRGSDQEIFKKVKIGSDTLEADGNEDTLEFAAGSGISLSVDSGNDKVTITNSAIPGFVKSGTYAILADGVTRVGVGTSSPSNTFELDSGTSDTSGFSFTRLTSSSPAGIGGGKVLSLDSGGRIILVADQTGDATPSAEAILPSATNGMTLYFNGTNWAASDNLFHDGGSVGISNAAPTSRLHVNTNLASKIGLIVEGYTSQTANLQEWRDVNGNTLSYIDANGVFNGTANVSGTLNPGLTNGSVLFQGASGITQDNSNFFWDDTNNRLGLGVNTPTTTLDVRGNTFLRATANSADTFTVTNSAGTKYLQVSTSGGFVALTDSVYVGTRSLFTGGNDQSLVFAGGGSSTNGANITLYGSTHATAPSITQFKVGSTEIARFNAVGDLGIGTTLASTTYPNTWTSNSNDRFIEIQSQAAAHNSGIFLRRSDLVTGLDIWSNNNTGNAFIDNRYNDSASALFFRVRTAGTPVTAMTILGSGNVGINTNAPATELTLFDTSTPRLTFANTARSASSSFNYVGLSSNGQMLQYNGGFNPQAGYGHVFLADSSNIEIMRMEATGNVGIGTATPIHKLHVAGVYAGNALMALNETGGTNAIFTASASGTTRMVLTNAGNLGLGTSSPATSLHVVGSTTYPLISENGNGRVYLGATSTEGIIASTNTNGGAYRPLAFETKSGYSMYLNTSGNVGINTTTPGARLDINGDLFAPSATFSANYAGGTALKVQGGPSANATHIVSVQNNSGTTLMAVDGFGRTSVKASGTVNTDFMVGGTTGSDNLTDTLVYFLTRSASQRGLVIRGAASQTSNLTEWQNSSGTVLARFNQNGQLFAPYGEFVTTSSSLPGLVVRGVSNQTAPIFRVQNSASSDQLVVDFNNNVGVGLTNPIHKLHVTGGYAGNALVAFNETNGQDILTASASGTTRMVLTNAGNLGLGTSNPTSKLTLSQTGNSSILIDSGNNAELILDKGDTAKGSLVRYYSGGVSQWVNGTSDSDLWGDGTQFYIGTAANDPTAAHLVLTTGGNVGIGTTSFGSSAAKVLALAGSTAPTTSITDGIQLFAVDVAGSHELQVRDEAGNTTTLSPHNFSLTGGRSEDLAWSFYSERNSLAINADMTKALRLVEKLSGEKLIYLKDLATGEMIEDASDATQLAEFADQGEISNIAKWNYQLWMFLGDVIFEKPVEFLASIKVNGKAVFASEAWFGGRTTFTDRDMAGYATIVPSTTSVRVTFEKPFAHQPVVTIAPKSAIKLDWFRVTEESTTGFVIEIPTSQAQDVVFSWTALAVENPSSFTSEVPAGEQPSTSSTPQPSEASAPSPTPTPVATPEPPTLESSASESASLPEEPIASSSAETP